ncbi:MAG: hypothetical protein ABJE47_01995 [bacterium]
MTEGLQHQIEQHGDAATLYLTGVVRGAGDITTLAGICEALPAKVRTLRLDLNAVQHIDADAMEAVGVMLCEWREQRAGDFRMFYGSVYGAGRSVIASRPVATYAALAHRTHLFNEALTGIYL